LLDYKPLGTAGAACAEWVHVVFSIRSLRKLPFTIREGPTAFEPRRRAASPSFDLPKNIDRVVRDHL